MNDAATQRVLQPRGPKPCGLRQESPKKRPLGPSTRAGRLDWLRCRESILQMLGNQADNIVQPSMEEA